MGAWPELAVVRATENGFLPGITKVAGGPYDVASDPSVAYDAAHRVWLISSLATRFRSVPRWW
jgi:hypothetical protein